MRIIFLNRFFYPDHSATGQMLSDLAFELAARGHGVTVIASASTYDGARVPKRGERLRGVEVVRLRTTRFGRDRLPGRAIDYLAFYIVALFSLLWRVKRDDIVVAMTDPPMLSVIAMPICAVKGAHSVNWLQDLFPEVASALGLGRGRKRKWALAFLQIARNSSLRAASANIAIGERMARNLGAIGVRYSQIRMIPNWPAGSIRPIAPSQNPLRDEWGLTDAFVIGYSGNLGRAHEIDTFLSAICELEQLVRTPAYVKDSFPPNFRWLFIGGGTRMEAMRREVTRRKLESVVFRPYQPQHRLPESLSLPDVHLISLRRELEGLIVPSKYYGIAAAGRPAIFVGDPSGEIAQILTRSRTGFAVCEGDGKTLAHAILTLAEDPALAASFGRAARALSEERYVFAKAASAWEQVLAEVEAKRLDPRKL